MTYVVIGGFARIVHGSAETSDGLDIAPSLREENLRRLGACARGARGAAARSRGASSPRSEPVTAKTSGGELRIVPEPWGTRGYDDLRIRAFRENLGRGARPQVASLVDCVRMLEASERKPDAERLQTTPPPDGARTPARPRAWPFDRPLRSALRPVAKT